MGRVVEQRETQVIRELMLPLFPKKNKTLENPSNPTEPLKSLQNPVKPFKNLLYPVKPFKNPKNFENPVTQSILAVSNLICLMLRWSDCSSNQTEEQFHRKAGTAATPKVAPRKRACTFAAPPTCTWHAYAMDRQCAEFQRERHDAHA